jgi:uncharacterized protein (DUF427 family)
VNRAKPEKESVWDYPRPPRLEPTPRRILVVAAGVTVADSTRALRILETSHPPTYYIPPEDVRMDLLEVSDRSSYCEFKGLARYFNLRVSGRVTPDCGWAYPEPRPPYGKIREHLAFYADRFDECRVDDERAIAQPGGFYGGWITSDLEGPFKGSPGSSGW